MERWRRAREAQRRAQAQTALFVSCVLVAAWLLPEFFIWIFSEYNILAGFGLLLLPGIGWVMGTQKANDSMERAEKMRSDAMLTKTEALSEAEDIKRQAERDTRTAEVLMNDANRQMRTVEQERIAVVAMRESVEIKNHGDDLRFIDMSYELPLEKRIEVSLRVGAYPSESRESYQRRRQELIERRVREWRAAKRFGQPLLPLVEEQRGLCGNPRKDPSRKGCGAYLYNFPVTAVHIDHITPQRRGGSDERTNLQALCSYCNTSAGSRT